MDQKDIKNLISGFLILAILTGSATLIISNFLRSPSRVSRNAPYAETSTPRTPRNAAPLGSAAPLDLTPEAIAQLPPLDSNNLTDRFAKSIADQIIKENERQPGQEENIGEGLAVPENLQNVTDSYLAQTLEVLPPAPPVDEAHLKIRRNPTIADLETYFQKIAEVAQRSLGEDKFERLSAQFANEAPSGAGLAAINLLYSQAIDGLYQLEVPEPLVEVHTALIRGLEAQRVAFDNTYQTDPLKAIRTIDNFENVVDQGGKDLSKAWERAQKKLSLLEAQPYADALPPGVRFLGFITGAKTANAVIVTATAEVPWSFASIKGLLTSIFTGQTSIAATGSWVQKLLEWARKLAKDILANQLVHRLVQQTIGWIQGGDTPGKSKIIENFRHVLDSTLNQSAMFALQGVSKNFCPSYAPRLVQQIATSYNSAPFVPAANCLLEEVVGNIDNFYDDFSLGGWDAYALSVLPGGNYFATALESQLTIGREARRSQQAKQQQLNTSGGFKSTQQCVKSYEAKFQNVTRDSRAAEEWKLAASKAPNFVDASCREVDGRIAECTARFCTPDGYTVTTPGSIVQGQLDKALGSNIEYIVNAQDIIALVNALVQSGLNKLFHAGDRGILGLARGGAGETVGGGGLVGGGSGGGGGGPPTDACAGLTGDELRDCRDSTRGDEGGEDLASQKTELLRSIDRALADIQKIETQDREWLSAASSTVPSLQTLAQECTNAVKQDAAQALAAIEDIGKTVNEELPKLPDAKRKFEDARAKIQSATSLGELSGYTGILAEATSYSAQTGNAEARTLAMRELKRVAEQKTARVLGILVCTEDPPLPSLR